jgi:ATP-dependent exoDNAse (exonuclease V) beta subunit
MNFSVIAPAGVGKTTAIAKRIAEIARRVPEKLDSLLVVTYTQKAAKELLERTNVELKSRVSEKINGIFFGTIHELATKIISENLMYLGLNPGFKIEQDVSLLWNDFSSENDHLSCLPEHIRSRLLSFLKYKDIQASYIHLSHYPTIGSIDDWPGINLEEVLAFKAGPRAKNITKIQNELKRWLDSIEKFPYRFPECSTKSRDFLEIYRPAVMPVLNWATNTYGYVINSINEKFLAYRIGIGKLTFDDLLKLANRVVYASEPYAIKLKQKKYSVILDEAQDTDPEQFKLLLGLVDKHYAENNYQSFPTNGTFCMVGDPQQSIYGDRTDVSTYLKIHNDLIANDIATELTFSLTQRFSRNIAKAINSLFDKILDGENGQVRLVKLDSEKTSATDTAWSKISVSNINDEKNEDPVIVETNAIKSLFFRKTPENFHVSTWSDIAILCPRRNWLSEIKEAFSGDFFLPKIQIQSQAMTHGDSTIFSWVTVVLIYLCEPDNLFEFAGILHEIFAIKDSAAADHFKIKKDKNIAEIDGLFEALRAEIYTKNISSILKEILSSIYLVDKCLAIFPAARDEIFSTLDYLFALAQDADAHGVQIYEFCHQLKQLLSEEQPPQPMDKNAIQLYTFHKAKGLEWEVVIFPFLFRGKRQHESQFPRLVRTESGYKIMLNALQETDYINTQKLTSRQNDERLGYVALTRQKSSAIFIDDRAIFADNSGSTAALLKLTDEASNNFILFNNLAKFNHEPATASAVPPDPKPWTTAGGNFLHSFNNPNEKSYLLYNKISPSSADHNTGITAENTPPKTDDHDIRGQIYGTLWHETLNSIQWNDKNFKQSMVKTAHETDNERLALEIDKLINCSPFMHIIQESDIVLTEYSFCVIHEKTTLIDGRIDMLVKTKNNVFIIIDWKTDFTITEKHFEKKYSNQITLYGYAITKIFNTIPEKYIYSTQRGKLIEI